MPIDLRLLLDHRMLMVIPVRLGYNYAQEEDSKLRQLIYLFTLKLHSDPSGGERALRYKDLSHSRTGILQEGKASTL